MSGYLLFGAMALAGIVIIMMLAKRVGRMQEIERNVKRSEELLNEKRKTRDRHNDDDYMKRVRDKFNDR